MPACANPREKMNVKDKEERKTYINSGNDKRCNTSFVIT
jgi:hypothetical protein